MGTPPTPKQPEPLPVPTITDPAILDARRRARQRLKGRSGFQSTILGGPQSAQQSGPPSLLGTAALGGGRANLGG